MTSPEDDIASALLMDQPSNRPSLAVALRPGKSGILGSYAKATAVLELIRQVPDISNEELKLAGLRSERKEDEDEDDDDDDLVEYTSIFINQPSRTVFTDLVKIRVGKTGENFEVHRKYLVNIPYFSGLLCGNFVEGGCSQANLPKDSPAAFERVLEYLYTGQVAMVLTSLNHDDSGADIGLKAHKETVLTMETYILADKLCLEVLGNLLIDALRKTYQDWPVGRFELKFALDRGNEILKRLTLRRLAFEIIQEGWNSCMAGNEGRLLNIVRTKTYYSEVVAKAIADYHKLGNPGDDTDACSWHMHAKTPKCGEAQSTKEKRDTMDDG